MRFAGFLSDGFTNMEVINPPERKLAKRTSVRLYYSPLSNRVILDVQAKAIKHITYRNYLFIIAAKTFNWLMDVSTQPNN